MAVIDTYKADPENWRDSRDIELAPGQWAPRYFRCTDARCLRLVTYGQIALGGCLCGNPRILAAGRLDWHECVRLKLGWYPLSAREVGIIHPWTLARLYGEIAALVGSRGGG